MRIELQHKKHYIVHAGTVGMKVAFPKGYGLTVNYRMKGKRKKKLVYLSIENLNVFRYLRARFILWKFEKGWANA